MKHNGTFFGAENGRDIQVTGPKLSSASQTASMATVEAAAATIDPGPWITGAIEGGTTRLGLGDNKLRVGEALLFEYGYVHEVPRTIDVVFKFVYDSAVLEPLPVQPAGGALD